MHPGAEPSYHSCTLVRHVAPPPATPRQQDAPSHPTDARAEASACAGVLAATSSCPRSGISRTARLHAKPSRPSARHQPLHPPPPAPLHRDDRNALGHQPDPRRRARAARRRTPPPHAAVAARSRAEGAEAERPGRGRRAHPRAPIGGPKPPPDRRRPQRRPNPDSTRRRAVVAVDSARPSLAGSLSHLARRRA